MERAQENYDQQMKDSDMIFTAISSGDFDDFKQAKQAVVMLYVMDMSFSRAGISHALERLEQFYAERPNERNSGAAEGGPAGMRS